MSHGGRRDGSGRKKSGTNRLDTKAREQAPCALRATASCARWAAAHGTSWHTSFLQYFIARGDLFGWRMLPTRKVSLSYSTPPPLRSLASGRRTAQQEALAA